MGLIDRILGKKQTIPRATEIIGRPGSVLTGGYLQSAEKDARLNGRQKYITYSDILVNTSIIAAGTRYFLNLITKSRWKVQAPDDSAEAQKYVELVEEIMDDMKTPWHQVIRRAAMYRFYGFSLQEWTAKKRDDGQMGFYDVAARPQSTINRWFQDDKGRLSGVEQEDPSTGLFITIPRQKLIYIVDDTLADTPEGVGIFRHVVEPAMRLRKYQQLEGFGFESDLHGTPIGKAPYAVLDKMVADGLLTSAQRAALIQPVETFITNHLKGPSLGLTLDSSVYRAQDETATPSTNPLWDMNVLRVGLGGSLQQVGHAIDRVNHDMARILGVEHLMMGGNDRGSYAMSKDKTANFYLMVDAAIQEINAVYQTDWLDVLWTLNGWPVEMKPKFQPETLKFSDVDQIATALRDMAIAGAVIQPDDPAVDDVRELLGISKTPDDYEDLPAGIQQVGLPGDQSQAQPGGQTQGTPKTNPTKKPAGGK